MKKCIPLLLALAASLAAQNVQNPAFEDVPDKPGLPRVLLIGDSISIGYTLPVRALLVGKANLHRIPTNGGPTSNGTAHIDEWLGASKWDIIHFNWGLHDLRIMESGKHQVPVDDYEKNLRALVKRLKATGATLIWASTTPVPDAPQNPPRKMDDVPKYNAIARRVMEENGVAVNDLYAFAAPLIEVIQLPANVHYKPEGYAALAAKVAAAINSGLPHGKP